MPPRNTQAEVGNDEPETHPPRVSRKSDHEYATGVIRRSTGQLGHVLIAADDSVHHDDIGRFDLGASLSKIRNPAFDTILEPGLEQSPVLHSVLFQELDNAS